jgi:phosphoglycolate phosphatase
MITPILIFDLDGTLTDPSAGIIACLHQTLDGIGVEIPPADVLRQCIGPPLRDALLPMLGDVAAADRALTLFRERYARTGLFENAPYPGIEQALETLSASAKLFIATSKPQEFADRIVDHFDLRRFFVAVYGCGMNGELADKAELIRHIIERENIPASDAVMIGDRKHDILAARANGIRSIGVTWGFGSWDELGDAGADALCASVEALPECCFSACIIRPGL